MSRELFKKKLLYPTGTTISGLYIFIGIGESGPWDFF